MTIGKGYLWWVDNQIAGGPWLRVATVGECRRVDDWRSGAGRWGEEGGSRPLCRLHKLKNGD